MVENGQVSAIRQMSYRPADPAATFVEVMSFERLRQINEGQTQRADFHVLALVDGGRGRVTVDFERCSLAPHTALWIRAGAVHRWDEISDVTGTLVLFVATAPVTDTTRRLAASTGPGRPWTVPAGDRALLATAVDHLRQEIDASARTTSPGGIPRILLSALLARLQPAPAMDDSGRHPLFHAFQVAVEAGFRHHHEAGHYAHELGYAPRTLSRAVVAATGTTAKAYLTQRLVLEAKRLLVHDRFTAARCARELGFGDPSNFSAFFLAATGERPGTWQRTNSG